MLCGGFSNQITLKNKIITKYTQRTIRAWRMRIYVVESTHPQLQKYPIWLRCNVAHVRPITSTFTDFDKPRRAQTARHRVNENGTDQPTIVCYYININLV